MNHEEALTIALLALRRIEAAHCGYSFPLAAAAIAREALEEIDSDSPCFTEKEST